MSIRAGDALCRETICTSRQVFSHAADAASLDLCDKHRDEECGVGSRASIESRE
jgi:hypothetical protein